jgi:hypothetical protein
MNTRSPRQLSHEDCAAPGKKVDCMLYAGGYQYRATPLMLLANGS